MQPQKPYLVRAFYNWVIDSQCTPHVLVDATYEGVIVPNQYVEDGEIVLNVSADAVTDLVITNKDMSFEARFSNIPTQIYLPMRAIMAVYANENGRGMVFSLEEEEDESDNDSPSPNSNSPVKKGRPNLRIVK